MRKSTQFLLLFLLSLCTPNLWGAAADESIYRNVLFNMNDYDSKYWRIPALVTAQDGSLVALVDKRGNSLGDLPNTISIMSRRSEDNGRTWSEPVVVAEGNASTGKTYGDAAVVLDRETGTLISMFVGDQGLWNATPSSRQGIYISKSTDNGISWSAPEAITDQVYANHSSWYAGFAGSGNGLQLKDGRLMFAVAIRPNGYTYDLQNYALYSDDHGATWSLSSNAATNKGDEAKLIELDNGDVLMSIRNPSKGYRMFSRSTDRGVTWSATSLNTDLMDPACNGDIIRYNYDGKNYLLHSLPASTSTRENVTIYLSDDEGETWYFKKQLVDGYSAYSSMAVLADGTIGVLVEEGKWDSNLPGEDGFSLVYYNFPLEWITEGTEIDPDLQESGTLQLNGANRYMRIPHSEAFNAYAARTYSVTLKVFMPEFTTSNCRFVAKRSYEGTNNSGTSGWELWGDGANGTGFSTNLSCVGSPWGGKGNGGGFSFSAGTWTHLAWVFDLDNNTTSVYIDGVLKEAKTLASEFATMTMDNTFDVLVGAGYTNTNGSESVPAYFVNGEIDDLRFWGKALSTDEIVADKTATVDATTENLLAAYDFSEISGLSVPDISGNGNEGTLVGFPASSTRYAIHITAPDASQGTFKVKNGRTEIEDGKTVAEGTILNVEVEPADGYQVAQVLVNGVALEMVDGEYTFTVEGETTVSVEFEEAEPAYCTYSGKNNHAGRWLSTLTMKDLVLGSNDEFAKGTNIYQDFTTSVFEAEPGETITPEVNWNGEWMHGYMYIDYNKDFAFDYTINEDGTPAEGSEIVSYTFYSSSDGSWGYNSAGESAQNNGAFKNGMPSFTLPADLAPGDYRVRFKIDWNDLDPCGHPESLENYLTTNGGIMLDFTMRISGEVVEETYTVSVAEVEGGTVSLFSDYGSIEEGESLNLKAGVGVMIFAEPEEGYTLVEITANDVVVPADSYGSYYTEITENTVITAVFEQVGGSNMYTVTVAEVEGGSIWGEVYLPETEEQWAFLAEGESGQFPDGSIGYIYIESIEDGYELKEATANGVALAEYMPNFYEYVINGADIVLSAVFEQVGGGGTDPEDGYCTYQGNNNHSQRWLRSLTVKELTLGSNNEFVKGSAVYQDYTSSSFSAEPGETIAPVVDWNGEWMHSYMYIDYNNDYVFTAELDDFGGVTPASELVSFTYYNDVDSYGGYAAANCGVNGLPEFTLPEDLADGDYRVRFKVDWNNIDPCGNLASDNLMSNNGGIMLDFTMKVAKGNAIEGLENAGVKVYATDGKIVIEAEEEAAVQIFTTNGVAFKAPFLTVGYRTVDAPAGMYIVNVNGVAKLVMVK